MTTDLRAMLGATRFDHEWLTDDFAAESQRQAQNSVSRKHHYVPQFYLKRWASGERNLVQPTQVDTRTTYPPQPAKDVAKSSNFYSLPARGDTMDLPVKWVETHLSRIESKCANRIDQLLETDSGRITDVALKRDLAVFMGLQFTRTPSQRERSLVIIKGPDSVKRDILQLLMPAATPEQLDESMSKRHSDPKHEALDLMIKDVRNVVASAFDMRTWAVYRTANPIATCDDPVIALAGPPLPRAFNAGALLSAVVLYPLDPSHVLVMLRPDLDHRGPFTLDEQETHSINIEIVGAATRTAFERPGDCIAIDIEVPRRAQIPELSDREASALDQTAAAALLSGATARSRWAPGKGPDWPVPRWYQPR